MEQALPLRADWLNFNRFRARAEHTVPMGPYRLLLCGKGAQLPCHFEAMILACLLCYLQQSSQRTTQLWWPTSFTSLASSTSP